MSARRPRRGAARAQGFTLVEVMVALIIIAIGMLGIAKLQGLALSNTSVARMRSLAAIEATSLAAAMHANRSFWAANTAPSFTATTTSNFTPTAGALTLGGATSCQGAVCDAAHIAGADVFAWISGLNLTLPSPTETVTCTTAVQPVGCTITVQWTENVAGANAQEAAAALTTQTQAIANPTYQLYVVP